MTHVIRTIGFPEGTIDVDSAFKNSSDVTAMVDSLTRGDSLEASVTRSTCSSLLSVLQEILATSPQVEAVWSKYGEKEQIRNGGVLCESYRVEKTTFFCPFSVAERTTSLRNPLHLDTMEGGRNKVTCSFGTELSVPDTVLLALRDLCPAPIELPNNRY